ncbi:glutamine synthetase cytosolic isozyme-like [Pistacia vera]|uniref:glutamine synthetase cytosolic isozyme-like n=1 Tax=Pistacia vera TaxID=55513 RepID=UPI001263CFE6|nr:glutamine synthetase cytosolic isozyme-like [Pistacia vera]
MSSLTDLVNLDLSESTDKIIAEYIWFDRGSGTDLSSKARFLILLLVLQTLNGAVSDPSELPKWSYDGSNTGQAPEEESEVILYPQAIFKDPFRRGNNILVMCDAYDSDGQPIPKNKRYAEEPRWYHIQQEYILFPLGWPVGGYPGPQGPYYCTVGAERAKDIVESQYKACLYAGINISAINGEAMPGEHSSYFICWQFQVGPVVGISAGDELWVARYILEVIYEIAGVVLSFDPKPIQVNFP